MWTWLLVLLPSPPLSERRYCDTRRLCLCVCLCVCWAANSPHISLGGAGNVLYPVLSSFLFVDVLLLQKVQLLCIFFFIRLHHIPMVKTIVFANIIIILSHFLSSQTKFSGQTRNLYRYGPQVDLRTLTQFQWPWPTFQGHRPIFVLKPRNFKSI